MSWLGCIISKTLGFGYQVPVFTHKSKRRMLSHSKFYFFDAGVYRAIRPIGPLDMPEQSQGHALETLFLQEVMAINAYLRLGYKIFYWQTSNGMEVDFVLYGEKGLLAFEIKRAGKLSSAMTRGLRAFLSDYPGAKAYLIYGGQRRLWEGAIEIVPFSDALRDMRGLLSPVPKESRF